MALFNATSLTGIALLLYLSSFVFFAILRIATGISIQRIGYFSLRHIGYTPKEGLRIDLRGLGLSVHKPSFAQPTWVSLRLTELKVTIDPALLGRASGAKRASEKGEHDAAATPTPTAPHTARPTTPGRPSARSKLWRRLTEIKERIKRIHRKIHWLRMLDLVAQNTSVDVVGVGTLHISAFSMAVHTRRKMLDRGRLFRHKKDPQGGQKPAEWIVTVKSVLLSVGGVEPLEVLDVATLNVHGILYRDKDGLRDTSIALKIGRLYLPVDEVVAFSTRAQDITAAAKQASSPVDRMSFAELVEELDRPGSREASIVQTVADSKEFLSSILQSVQEIQLAMNFVRFSKEIESLHQPTRPLVCNVVTHEIGFDLHRLDQSTPAHRMYFARNDVAHQALLAAISISVSLDDDEARTNKIMYIPMATTTIRTTLPSKTMTFTEDRDVAERNTNILFANLVVTSPSVDLEPHQLTRLLAIAQRNRRGPSQTVQNHHRLISRLLPKSSIKLSIHEPVVRFVLPIQDAKSTTYDFDMIISVISSISLDIESSHSTSGDLLYSLASNYRLLSHQLYYQAASGVKHNLIVTDSLDIKFQVSASTDVYVVVSASLQSFSVLMVREEVSSAVYNIIRHFKRKGPPDTVLEAPAEEKTAFLRRLPPWLLEFHCEGSDCSVQTAGLDQTISKETRGVALQVESWTAAYQAQSTAVHRRSHFARPGPIFSRGDRRPSHLGEPVVPATVASAKQHPSRAPSDGRRLAVHVKRLEGFVIESLDQWEPNPFLSIPRFEVAFSTSRDLQGPIFHVNSAVRALFIDYSLYRFYCIGVASSIIKDAFLGPPARDASAGSGRAAPAPSPSPVTDAVHPRSSTEELVTVDVKAAYLQLKAELPDDPHMLLQIYDVAAGQHRWSAPFLRTHLLRLHVESPSRRGVWARMVSINSIRSDIRHSKRKTAAGLVEERSLDISTDFIRLAVPYGVTLHRVTNNLTNVKKATEQLVHRFQTRTNEYILEKVPEAAKQVPRVSLRCKALIVEVEDDPFEWKLGTIYHAGQVEQKQRIARAEAFRVKVKKLNEERVPAHPSRSQTQSNRPASQRGRLQRPRRTRSQDSDARDRSRSRDARRPRGRERTGKLRYDREGVCVLTGSAQVDAKDVQARLDEHNARSWKKRIDAICALQHEAVSAVRRVFSGADEPPHDEDEHETILGIPNRPGLMTTIFSDVHLVIDKPSFPMHQLPQFMHDVGKGMPLDMQYALLVPMHLALDVGEAKVMLRDYPLALLHIPAIQPGQPPRLPSWSLRTNFVIAEEFRDHRSSRHVKVDIIPKGKRGRHGVELPGFAIDVRRTVSPVKTYTHPTIDINTNLPTTFSWGTSYQPVLQDLIRIFEGFSKPEVDASEKVGFWDKIRMAFHSRLLVNWKGDGDVQLRLKGSRDPYVVTGYGAGFVMCWRNDVQWAIHADTDAKRFMYVKSSEYVLAVPDYSHEARRGPDHRHDSDSVSSGSSQKNAAQFKKVVMKLTGKVEWSAGLVFERELDAGGRSYDFRPHYDVVLCDPKHLSADELDGYDAFRGFRSHHIHLSVAVAAPTDRDWTSSTLSPSDSYNTVHLTPRFFSHFFDWWHLFAGAMSLPVRQGNLWGPGKVSKKFGRHLATIKYKLLLSPLFIAHVYKHKDAEDYQEDKVSATGLKLRIDSFLLDLHQRREFFDTLSKSKAKQARTSGMKIHQAELDFVSADLRAVSANIAGTTAEELLRATDDALSAYPDTSDNVDMSQFTIPDLDFTWIDMDDFVELDWVLPSQSNPETKILPLAFTPRFTYFRQTDHGDSIHGDPSRTSSFGDESSHYCVMSRHNDPRKVQMELIRARLDKIEQQLAEHQRVLGEQELKVVRDGDQDPAVKDTHESLLGQELDLRSKQRFLHEGLRRLMAQCAPGEADSDGHSTQDGSTTTSTSDLDARAPVDMDALFSSQQDEFSSDFNNRFIVHNAQLKWNNALRNTILRYSHQVSQRRGFVYYMSRRAVKFILDIVDEQARSKQTPGVARTPPVPATPTVMSPSDEQDDDTVVQDRIQQLLGDAMRFVDVDDSERHDAPSYRRSSTADFGDTIADNFKPLNSYHIRAIAPQIQLQSEKNTAAVVLVSAKGMQFKVISVMDKERMSDDVSGLVQRRFALDMDGAQFFVATQKGLARFMHLYSGNRYGNKPGTNWPPWVSLEVMFDFHLNPFGFQRVIQRTSASLRYEKFNTLRLKYNEEVATGAPDEAPTASDRKESRIDHIWVDFPRIRASCDSAQYYAMYVIVLDLLMYSEPLEKTRSERLEKIMLASDFSDLRGAPEIAERLQERIRQLEDIKTTFQINAKYLDRDGWQDRINLEKDLSNCEDELFFIMKAITTSQQKSDDRKTSQSSGLLRWYLSASEIVWHLMRDKTDALVEFQLGHASYERVDNSDGSNENAIVVESIRGLNLLKNALYPEIISPYHDSGPKAVADRADTMLQIKWFMLEAIAGIPVLEDFHVTLYPVRIQLERDLGNKLFEYIFPGTGAKAFDGGQSPFQLKSMESVDDDDDESDVDAASSLLTPNLSRNDLAQADLHAAHPGAITRRLRPTYNMKQSQQASAPSGHKPRGLGISADHGFRLFKHGNNSTTEPPRSAESRAALAEHPPMRKTSNTSLVSLGRKLNGGSSTTNLQAIAQSKTAPSAKFDRDPRFKRKNKKAKPSDDLTQMMSRASSYMTLAHVKLDSVVLCLSYKGKDTRNLEDLHNFVFRMPVLEYSNKTWSNLDLVLRLKRDVIKALISHTGAIIGNKFGHRGPDKHTVSRMRDLASGSAVLPNSDTLANTPSTSETASLYSVPEVGGGDDDDDDSPDPSRLSFNSSSDTRVSPLLRNDSWASSSLHSLPASSSNGVAGSGIHWSGMTLGRASTGADPTRPGSQHRSLLQHTLGRHFEKHSDGPRRARSLGPTSAATPAGNTDGAGNEDGGAASEGSSDAETHRKKSVLLLGKKILGSLS